MFEQAFATSPWTLPSFGSMYTGQAPTRHSAGVRLPDDRLGMLDSTVVTLAEALAGQGYATAAIMNNPFLDPSFGIARGFELYDYEAGSNTTIRRADVIVDRTLDWLDQRDARPFLLVAHFFDPHMSYDPPESVRGRFTRTYTGPLSLPVDDLRGIRRGTLTLTAEDREFIIAAYDEELLGVDGALGRLLDGVRARGLLENTIVIVTSDHGEELFDHGGFEHGHSMHREVVQIPLLVWGPDVAPQRRDEAVSVADLFPTVLDALGHAIDDELAGRSLWRALVSGQKLPARPILLEGTLWGPEQKALIRWPYKLSAVSGEPAQLFDLVRDPHELSNQVASEPARVKELANVLTGRLADAQRALIEANAAEIPEQAREQLEALGYLD